MLELKFYSRDGRLAYDPTRARRQGQLPPYIGRTYDPKTRETRADDQPYTIRIADPSSAEGTKWLARVKKQAQRGDIWPADAATAAHVGAPFQAVEKREGEWVEAKPAPAKKGQSSAKKGSD